MKLPKVGKQFAFGVGVGLTATYLFHLAKTKGWLPGVPRHVA